MKLFITALAIIGSTLFAGWLAVSVYTKSRYDRIRKQQPVSAYAVVPIDQEAEAFLSSVQSNWLCKADATAGGEAEMVKLTGKAPSVRNLINACNYRMPPYNWFSHGQNHNAASLGLLQWLFPPTTVDKKWHVSRDEHLAMLYGTNRVYLYRDEGTNLRVTLYLRKENIEPGGSANRSQPVSPNSNSVSPAAGSGG